ncbi:MAG: hypothetical protein ACK5LT_05830 [Lachnospirales bacterium]
MRPNSPFSGGTSPRNMICSELYKNELDLIKSNLEEFNKLKYDLKKHLLVRENILRNGSSDDYEGVVNEIL